MRLVRVSLCRKPQKQVLMRRCPCYPLLSESQDRSRGRGHGRGQGRGDETFRKNAGRSRCCIAVIIIGVIILLAMGVGLGLYFGGKASNENVEYYLSNRYKSL